MSTPAKLSYGLIALTLLLVGWLHMAVPFITVLFSTFALQKLRFWGRKDVAIAIFSILVVAFFYVFVFFIERALDALPKILDSLVPLIIEAAKEYKISLPFTDVNSLKEVLLGLVKDDWLGLGNLAKNLTRQLVFLLIGIVVAISLFLNSTVDLARETHFVKNNLYSLTADEMTHRFRSFYDSFSTVMGAQIAISTINTALTAIFILGVGMDYPRFLIIITFACGLLPIVGNVISNTFIVSVGLTVSWKLALGALAFLIVIHKLEYFLNSKIIGDRIKNPMWLTLLGLILGERLMGIPGMILAPVVLHYIKTEATKHQVAETRSPVKEPAPVN
ncbi:MAG: AI-2E family transporter [Verrucomicrobia bacterium]|nr:AI-2E family transporter [Verrucomicrobiota bacterium]